MSTTIGDADLRDIVQRMHVARWSGRLPQDLADAVLDVLGDIESRAERRRYRDHWLRVAGRLWTGSPWVRSRYVREELVRQSRRPIVETLNPETFPGAIRTALMTDPRVPSRKQLARILERHADGAH